MNQFPVSFSNLISMKFYSYKITQSLFIIIRNRANIGLLVFLVLSTLTQALAQSNHADITITTGATSGGSFTGTAPNRSFVVTAGQSSANIQASVLVTELTTNNVSISTASTGGNGSGNVTFSTAVTAAQNTTSTLTFTITANGTINVNAALDLTASGAGGSNHTARQGMGVNFTAVGTITIGTALTTTGNKRGNSAGGNGGNIVLTSSGGNISVTAALTSNGAATATNNLNGGNGGTITLTSTVGSVSVTNNIASEGAAGDNTGTDGNGGAVTLAGATGITLTGNISTITNAGGGTLGTAGSVTFNDGAATVTTGGGANDGQSAASVISGGALTKTGNGRFAMAGTNTYTGATTVTAGFLRADATVNGGNGAFGASGSTLTLNGGTIESNTATFSRAITITATNSGIDAFGAARTISSTITNTSGTNNLNVGGTTVSSQTGQDLVLSGVISASGGTLSVTKIGTSMVTISNTNTFTGGATLSAGTLNINAAAALGASGTFTISGGTIDNTNTTLTTNNYTLALNGDFTFTGTNSLNLGTGSVTLSASRQITASANTLTIGGTINHNTLTLTKAGAGTLSFGSQSVTLSGLTISAGTLTSTSGTLALAGNFSNSGTFTHNSGTVNFNGTSQNIGAATFNNLTCSNSGTKSMTGSVTVSGALTLSSAKLSIGASNTLTLNGDFNGSSSACLLGSNTSNVSIGGTGAMTTSLFFENAGTATDSTLNNLTINRGSQTITLGNKLMLLGTLTPTAGTFASGGNLILASTASTTARVATVGGSVTGSVRVQRFIPSSARRWRFLASPVAAATLADWKNEIQITGTGGITNGFDASGSNATSVFTYNEALTSGDLNTGWEAASGITNAITVGKGYRVFVRGTIDAGRLTGLITTQDAITLDLNGTLTTGDVNMNPTFNSSGTLANDGWNLMGNPYASPIDWNAFHDASRSGSDPDFSGTDYAHLDPSIFIYDASSNSYLSYNALSAGTLTNGIIPSGAAFWVKAVASSPTMTMKETYKTSSTPVNVFKTNEHPDLTIRLFKDQFNYDDLIIKYIDESKAGFDAYDINKMWSSEVNLAAMLPGSKYLALNAKPSKPAGDTIPISAYVRANGEYTLNFSNTETFAANKPLYLLDFYNGNIVDLRSKDKYIFTADMFDPNSYGDNRFALVVGTIVTSTNGFNDLSQQSEKTLYPYPQATRDFVTIMGMQAKNAEIQIRDMSGKLMVAYFKTSESNQMELNLSTLPSAMYMIWVQQGMGGKPEVLRCIKQ